MEIIDREEFRKGRKTFSLKQMHVSVVQDTYFSLDTMKLHVVLDEHTLNPSIQLLVQDLSLSITS